MSLNPVVGRGSRFAGPAGPRIQALPTLRRAHESDRPNQDIRSFSALTLLLAHPQFAESFEGNPRTLRRRLITFFP